MKINNQEIDKKKKFTEVYEDEIIFTGTFVLSIISVLTIPKLFRFIINSLSSKYFVVPAIIIIITLMVGSLINKIVSKRKLAYLPTTKEEYEKLGVENLYEMFMFLNKFLRFRSVFSEDTSCIDYLLLDEEQSQSILDLFSNNGEIKIRKPGSHPFLNSFYHVNGYEYRYIEWIEEYEEELKSIALMEEN